MKTLSHKTSKQKNIFVLILLFLLSMQPIHLIAQSNDWVLYSEKDGIKFSYKLDECASRNVMFLEFENTLNTDVTIDFQLIAGGDEIPMTLPKIIQVKANETIMGSCSGLLELIKELNNPGIPSLQFTMKLVN